MLFHTWHFFLFFLIVYPGFLLLRKTAFKNLWLLAPFITPEPPFSQEETRVYLQNSRTVDTLEIHNTIELKPSSLGAGC
ncbi:MAG: hypothetical protein ACYSTF_06155 [Planctomycetota bacterium]|jgi:hypothetical protein